MEPKSGILSADYKVVGGKLLRVRLQVEEDVISSIKITGDFFMHPEAAIETLERMLCHIPLRADAVASQVRTFFEADVEVVGAKVEDFVTVIMNAR